MRINPHFIHLDDDMLELDPTGPRKNINQRRFREGDSFDSSRPARQADAAMRDRRVIRRSRTAERHGEWSAPRMLPGGFVTSSAARGA